MCFPFCAVLFFWPKRPDCRHASISAAPAHSSLSGAMNGSARSFGANKRSLPSREGVIRRQGMRDLVRLFRVDRIDRAAPGSVEFFQQFLRRRRAAGEATVEDFEILALVFTADVEML